MTAEPCLCPPVPPSQTPEFSLLSSIALEEDLSCSQPRGACGRGNWASSEGAGWLAAENGCREHRGWDSKGPEVSLPALLMQIGKRWGAGGAKGEPHLLPRHLVLSILSFFHLSRSFIHLLLQQTFIQHARYTILGVGNTEVSPLTAS